MKFSALVRTLVAVVVLFCLAQRATAAPTSDGLYATIQISRDGQSVGELTFRLEHDKAPLTVANFISLAEGTRPFVDFINGHAVRRRFYDGLTFHRVVPGFVVQGGSPRGDGSDGPGYTFPDEFHETLVHDKAGILSMANSGLNSNGSQFFITLAATPTLNNVHNVFGEIVEGTGILNDIQVGDTMTAITITRNGASAQAFDPLAQGLPEVTDANPGFSISESSARLNFTRTANSQVFVFRGDTVAAWSLLPGVELNGPLPVQGDRDVSTVVEGKEQQFFTVIQAAYPDDVHTATSVDGYRLVLSDVSGVGGFTFTFDSQNGDTYGYFDNQGTLGPWSIHAFSWNPEAYRGHLVAQNIFNSPGFIFGEGPAVAANFSFVFGSPTGGSYSGYFINSIEQRLFSRGSFSMEQVQ